MAALRSDTDYDPQRNSGDVKLLGDVLLLRLCCPKHTNEAWRNCDQIEWFKFYVNVIPLFFSTLFGVIIMYVQLAQHQDSVDRDVEIVDLVLVPLPGASGGVGGVDKLLQLAIFLS